MDDIVDRIFVERFPLVSVDDDDDGDGDIERGSMRARNGLTKWAIMW